MTIVLMDKSLRTLASARAERRRLERLIFGARSKP
jgi:hypothetical protein